MLHVVTLPFPELLDQEPPPADERSTRRWRFL